ncbi:MAG: hypothetical protein PHN78_07510 [Dehalococcoidales bacterium]|nr:hypothetical protein [Dehalococcoidales bacterium]
MARITKSVASQRLGDVPPDKSFWSHDGQVLNNLAELETALSTMSDETYHHHVSENNNDFSNWVRDVIGDDKLAADLAGNSNRAEAVNKVTERISWLKNRAGL